MKRSLIVLTIILCIGTICCVLLRVPGSTCESPAKHAPQKLATRVPQQTVPSKEGSSMPMLAERRQMSRWERIRLLERMGAVPDDGDAIEYALAESTSWWGKRLDPKTFWRDRVIWYDRTAEFEARRRGRGYPPIPSDDSSVAGRSDNDKRPQGVSVEGPTIRFVYSEKESAFWDKFIKTHPHPPEDLDKWIGDRAAAWLDKKGILLTDPIYAKRMQWTPEDLRRDLDSDVENAKVFGYPKEAVSPGAYYWTHVMAKRAEYQELVSDGASTLRLDAFFDRVYVDRKLITGTSSAEDIRAANAWKVAYLRRLRQEKTDESYINAYLHAWRLSSNEVFGVSEQKTGE